MKLSVTQIALGILIVLVAGYIIWWMFFGVAPLLEDKILNESGALVTNVTLENAALFTAARYASFLLFACGVVAVILGAFGKIIASIRKIAVTEIVLGVLIVLISAYLFRWGYALDFVVMIEGGPVLDMSRAKAFTILTALFGLAITGAGIGQFVKVRR